jgi:predicted amidophosphoribosyltransferase
VLQFDLPQILQLSGFTVMTVCVVPRAKAEDSYSPDQLLFKSTVRFSIEQFDDFENGTDYIRRHTNTKTTHLKKSILNFQNDGPNPFPGITAETCHISSDVTGKDILLIDDIYTPGVNIDEDAIQALLNAGAKTVTFFAVGKTQTWGIS